MNNSNPILYTIRPGDTLNTKNKTQTLPVFLFFGANDVDIYNSLALLTIDIIINQLINILTDY